MTNHLGHLGLLSFADDNTDSLVVHAIHLLPVVAVAAILDIVAARPQWTLGHHTHQSFSHGLPSLLC